jgi:hypothetical protein
MPTESSYDKLDIPNVDLWAFLFERKDREFPDDKGMSIASANCVIALTLRQLRFSFLLSTHLTPHRHRALARTTAC